MPRQANGGDWLILLALTAMWGTAFLFNEFALVAFSPAQLVGSRMLIAAAVLFAYLKASGARLPAFGRGWLPMIVMALLGSVLPFQLTAWAQLHIDSALTGVLMAVMPLFVLTLAHFFVPGASLSPGRITGFLIGFAGVAIVIGPGALSLNGPMTLPAIGAVLLAALSYSINTIYARRLGARDPVALSAGMMLVGAMLTTPHAAIGIVTLPAVPPLAAALSVLVLGLLSTGLATVLYFRLVQGPGPTFVSFVNYLVPVWAVLAGGLVLGESLSGFVFLGLGLILGGIAVSEFGTTLLRGLTLRTNKKVSAAHG
ncbi:MAG: DMT family transporter [Woeseiaceae bacterium]|nr:DMT family transporter [Woeseiaceae bacterium]